MSFDKNSTSRATALAHHDQYYLQDGVIFLVENTLFKVPRYMLVRESTVFADMFSLPTGEVTEGKIDFSPIQLEQVTIGDFVRLLEVLYPLKFSDSPMTNAWGESEWKSLLHLATMWQMADVRSLAIRRLTGCAAATSKIALGRQYDHPSWIRDGFLDLCIRSEPLTKDEASIHLSVEDIVGVAATREKIRRKVLRSSCCDEWIETRYGSCLISKTSYAEDAHYYTNKLVHQILEETFDLEDSAVYLDSVPNSLAPTPMPPSP